jgi:hypothetical protein
LIRIAFNIPRSADRPEIEAVLIVKEKKWGKSDEYIPFRLGKRDIMA